MTALDAIVFDFDGVIADSEKLHLKSYQQVLAPLGLGLDEEAYYRHYLGYDDLGVFRTYARQHDLDWTDDTIRELIAAKSARYEALTVDGEMLFPGAVAFVCEAARTLPLAIASGALTHEIVEILDRVDLTRHFVAIVGADQTSRSKPSPDPYLEAMHRLRAAARPIDAARTVAIEDSVWGLVSAVTAGMRVVAVTNTLAAHELAIHAELVVSGLDTLTLDALEALCRGPRVAGAAAGSRGTGR